MRVDLGNRVALVTGSTKGIGREVARALCEAGARVVVCSRTAEQVAATCLELGGPDRARGMAVDLREPASAARLVDFGLREFGRLDILVNNAVTSVQERFEQLGDEDWALHIDTKLLAYVRLCRTALPHLAAGGAGRIVNVAGMSARQVTDFRMTNGAVNSAVTNFTKHLSRQCGPRGVTANVVHPGYTWTPRLEQGLTRWAQLNGTDVAQEHQSRLAEIPIGRFVQPADIASLVVFLASPLASAITGQAIAVDGGSGHAISY